MEWQDQNQNMIKFRISHGVAGKWGSLWPLSGVCSVVEKGELSPPLLNCTSDPELQSNVILDKWASNWNLKIFVVEIFTLSAFEIWFNIIGGKNVRGGLVVLT